MPKVDLEEKLASLTARRDLAKADLERKKGRLEESERRYAEVEEKCRERKVEPEKLGSVVMALEKKLEKKLKELEEGLEELESQLAEISEKGEKA